MDTRRKEIKDDVCPHCGQTIDGYVIRPKPTPDEIEEVRLRAEDRLDTHLQSAALWGNPRSDGVR